VWQLNGIFTRQVKRRHWLVGHLILWRFKSILGERDICLLKLARYSVLNPMGAGTVADADDWGWSSYAAMPGRLPAPPWLEADWVLGQFGRGRAAARAAYAAFVADGAGRSSVWDGLRCQVFLGTDGFVERHHGLASDPQQMREVPKFPGAQHHMLAKPLMALGDHDATLREAMTRTFLSGVYAMQEIAEHLGVHSSTVSRAVTSYSRSSCGSGLRSKVSEGSSPKHSR
jgi:hypothetical protein